MERGFLLTDKLKKCPDCGKYLDLSSDRVLIEYFENGKVVCPYSDCKQNLKLFELLLGMLDEHSALFGMHYELLGCKHYTVCPIIKTNQYYNLDLKEEIGNGKLVNVISINPREPQIGNIPVISAPSIYPRDLLFENNELSIYGLPIEGGEDTKYLISFIFAPEEVTEDLSNMLLLDAFRFYAEEDYRNMVLSANTAVEILFNKFFNNLLCDSNSLKNEEGNISSDNKDRIKGFLKNGATYGYKLYPFFPFISEIREFPGLNRKISKKLDNLKDKRNRLIHEGKPDLKNEEGLKNREEIKEELIAAFLTFKYFKLIHGF